MVSGVTEKFIRAWWDSQEREFFNNLTSEQQKKIRDYYEHRCETSAPESRYPFCCDILGFCPFPASNFLELYDLTLLIPNFRLGQLCSSSSWFLLLLLVEVLRGGVAFWFFYLKRKRGGKDNNNEMESGDDSSDIYHEK